MTDDYLPPLLADGSRPTVRQLRLGAALVTLVREHLPLNRQWCSCGWRVLGVPHDDHLAAVLARRATGTP